jgi:hypothetical protein
VGEPVATQCGTSLGECDADDFCDGVGAGCTDVKLTTQCRAGVDVCDAPESCDGAANDCPADALEPPTTVCRTAVGPCDSVESCTGVDTACPADLLEPPTTVCRPAAGPCDLAENCVAGMFFTSCPVDKTVADDTRCLDGNICNGDEICQAGACVADTPALDCDDGLACTADSCDSVTGCGHAAIPFCSGPGPTVPGLSSWSIAVLGLLILMAGSLLTYRPRVRS